MGSQLAYLCIGFDLCGVCTNIEPAGSRSCCTAWCDGSPDTSPDGSITTVQGLAQYSSYREGWVPGSFYVEDLDKNNVRCLLD